MKIAIASSYVPFIDGGARNFVEWLQTTLLALGHQVELFYLPMVEQSCNDILPQIAAYRYLSLESADRLICTRPPAYFIPHPNKIVWFIHHFRAFYDLWGTEYAPKQTGAMQGLRDVIRSADSAALAESRRIFTNSAVVAKRLKDFNDIDSEVLYPPLLQPESFYCRQYGDEILCVSRIEGHKRQSLLIEAVRHCRTPVKLRLCGKCQSETIAQHYRSMIADHGLEGRVVFENRWVSEDEKRELFANCLAAAYVPFDEDSYGYPTLEAACSEKPILTTWDSGGVLEFVESGSNGIVADAEPVALAEAMDKLYSDRDQARRFGQNAKQRLEALKINWPHVLERLLA